VGLLVPIEHEGRLDHHTASRVARALGNTTLHVSSFRPSHDRLPALLARLVPGSATTINLERGHHLPVAALDAFALADDGTTYVDLGSADANLRVWSNHAWVHVTPLPLGGLAELVAILGEVFDVDVPPVIGEHRIGTLEVDLVQRGSTATIRTPDRARALRFFARTCGPRHFARGHISHPSAAQLAQLAQLADLMHAEVLIDAELAPEIVAELLDVIPCTDWQCDDLAYEPDAQRLYTYRVHPIPEDAVTGWRANVSRALAAL